MLRVERIRVFYGDVQALWDVSLAVAAGEIVALVGANAAGKSTTLRAISGLVRVRSGQILLDDEPIHFLPPHRIVEKGIVHVPEGRRLFTTLTVRENLEMGAFTPRARRRVKQRLAEVLELFPELADRLGQLAGSLSGGQQQMCALARGLMAVPRLLIIDEMSLGLAPLLVRRMFEAVRRIAETGVTILLVEQNIHHALTLAHRAYVLENGRIVMEGPARELASHEHLKRAYLGI